ncbi:hypothetical protein J6590_020484 [Homalodisca vitripennis]|nr:hypothetical protein J6590_020484 [Homalodisca vitripennis]
MTRHTEQCCPARHKLQANEARVKSGEVEVADLGSSLICTYGTGRKTLQRLEDRARDVHVERRVGGRGSGCDGITARGSRGAGAKLDIGVKVNTDGLIWNTFTPGAYTERESGLTGPGRVAVTYSRLLAVHAPWLGEPELGLFNRNKKSWTYNTGWLGGPWTWLAQQEQEFTLCLVVDSNHLTESWTYNTGWLGGPWTWLAQQEQEFTLCLAVDSNHLTESWLYIVTYRESWPSWSERKRQVRYRRPNLPAGFSDGYS